MLLECTLVRGPGSRRHSPPVELTVEAPARTAGVDLESAIAEAFGTGELSVDGLKLASLTLGEPPLVNGAVIVDGGTRSLAQQRRQAANEQAPLALAVHSGAGAGTVVPLRRGTYTIGRSNADVVLRDPDLSRQHARLLVSETAITIEDLDSANGTDVDGEAVRNAVIATGSIIRCGNSTMSLTFVGPPGPAMEEAGANVQEPLVIARRADPGNRGALLVAAVLPLVLGVGLAIMTGMWMFLAFTAVSAVSVLVPVISGRRQRRDLATAVASAVRQDQDRRRRAAPALSEVVMSLQPHPPQDSAPSPQQIWLRLGLAVQGANIRFEPSAPDQKIPSAGLVPLTLDPARSITAVSGPQDSVDGLLRSMIMQLAGYPRANHTRVVVHGPPGQLPLTGRFLPDVTLTATSAAATAVLARDRGPLITHGVLLVIDDPGGPTDDEEVVALAVENHWQVIRFRFRPGSMAPADIELGDRVAEMRSLDHTANFVPDLAPVEVFSRFCRLRSRAAAPSGKSAAQVPNSCLLRELIGPSDSETSARWAASRHQPGLAVPIGLAADREQILDLQSDGPHLLIAGTTGSGKSELLRSMATALALCYPPDRVNFLFIDFKGGSGLGPLQGLPHCVGMLTDLTSQELERSLVSLRAEIRFREERLASIKAPDLASYRAFRTGGDPVLPHLAVVIDEFRMLVDHAPTALTELMRIAAIGRSLGIHLIMATQRPQGALTGDIRANVTTSIALRVQSEMESTDIINSKAASAISLDTPGRAFLVRGGEEPQEFQAASLTGLADLAPGNLPAGIRVRLASESLRHYADVGAPAADQGALTPTMAMEPLIGMMSSLWDSLGGQRPRPPVAEPLPGVLERPMAPAAAVTWPALRSWNATPQNWVIRLGLMDLPDEQRMAPFDWLPAEHGHLGFVGAPEAGVPEALAVTVRELVSHSSEVHFYILDADGSLDGIEASPHVGAKAGPQELRRAVRILERLKRELSQRLSRPPGSHQTPLLLIITSWGTWASSFRAGPHACAEDLLHDLLRDGGRAGIVVAISGQRELVTARFYASVPNRLYFPHGSNDDSRLAWPKLPSTDPIPGRAVAFGPVSAGKPAACQFYAQPGNKEPLGTPAGKTVVRPVVRRPFRVDPLPTLVRAEDVMAHPTLDEDSVSAEAGSDALRNDPSARGLRTFVIGLGGDELVPVGLRIPAGAVIAVLGGHGGGKTNFLRLLPALNRGSAQWLAPVPGRDPCEYWSGALREAAAGTVDRRAIALVDDADLLPQSAHQDLADLNSKGISVVFTAGFSPLLVQRMPLALNARGSGFGLLIAPRSVSDGDLFGLRFDVEPSPPPGRSILITNGRPMPVQLGWLPGPSKAGSPKPQTAGGELLVRDA
jgi:S-DNA-T family DNA segregation ATPase FtsK/SpoIIIE